MANLRTLLTQRAAQVDVPIRDGTMFTFHPFKSTNTNSFCWISPGTGTAILEVWGGGGGGAHGQYCGISLPGNSGAYSRTVIPVTSSSFMCGAIGGGAVASGNNNIIPCRGNCSHVGIAPSGTLTRCVITQGGAGGYWMCFQAGSAYCCFTSQGFCGTIPAGYSSGCGIICNVGFVASTTACCLTGGAAACACGGDINVSGGISCLDMFSCDATCCNSKHVVSYPAGLRSLTPGTISVCACESDTHGAAIMRPEMAFELHFTRATTGVGHATRHFAPCMGGYVECSCYAYSICQNSGIVGAGYPGTITGGSVTSGCGSRGGPGLVKITFI
jgi:hypothetical protein